MAEQQQHSLSVRYIDDAEVRETFADSLRTMAWDGQTLRIEFCVTRYPDAASGDEARRLPSCRLVLTAPVAADLFNRLNQTMATLTQVGVMGQRKTESQPPSGSA